MHKLAAVLVVASASSAGLAQWIGPPVRANPSLTGEDEAAFYETAIAASKLPGFEHQIIVAYNAKYFTGMALTGARVRYAISTSASYPLFSTSADLPLPTCLASDGFVHGIDPMVAASSVSGDLWVGATKMSAQFSSLLKVGFYLARNPVGTSALDPLSVRDILCNPATAFHDKALLAVGPRSDGTGETMYLGARLDCTSYRSVLAECDAGAAIGTAWTGAQGGDLRAITDTTADQCLPLTGPTPLVLPGGRVVVPYAPRDVAPPHRPPPGVMYSDSGGIPTVSAPTGWFARTLLNTAFDPAHPLVPESISSYNELDIPGNFPVPNMPGACVDPRQAAHPDVYVTFAGISPSEPTLPRQDTDIYIARGARNTATGQLVFSGLQTIRLTDAQLGASSTTDQFMPWVAVDKLGGINLVYNAVVEPGLPGPGTTLQTFYARIPAWNVPLTQPIFVQPLTGQFKSYIGPFMANNEHVGDYQMIIAQGCYVYVAYMSTEPDPTGSKPTEPTYNIWVRKINICPPDSDDDGAMTAADTLAFGTQFVSGDPRADLTLDGQINAADVARFVETLACGCSGSP